MTAGRDGFSSACVLALMGSEGSDPESEDFRVISVSTRKMPKKSSQKQSDECSRSFCTGKVLQSVAQPEASGSAETTRINHNSQGLRAHDLILWVQTANAARRRSESKFSQLIRDNKNFRNPAILEKMVLYCAVSEYGSNLPAAQSRKRHRSYQDIASFQEICMKDGL